MAVITVFRRTASRTARPVGPGSVGVRQVLAPSAVGSLTMSYGPGTLAIPDQLVDRTTSRAQTFYDEGEAVHVDFADPYCPVGRSYR